VTAKRFDIKASTDRCRSLQCSAPGQHVTVLCRKALRGAYPRSDLGSYIALKKKIREEFFSFTGSHHQLLKEPICRLHDHKTLLRFKLGWTSRNRISIPSF